MAWPPFFGAGSSFVLPLGKSFIRKWGSGKRGNEFLRGCPPPPRYQGGSPFFWEMAPGSRRLNRGAPTPPRLKPPGGSLAVSPALGPVGPFDLSARPPVGLSTLGNKKGGTPWGPGG